MYTEQCTKSTDSLGSEGAVPHAANYPRHKLQPMFTLPLPFSPTLQTPGTVPASPHQLLIPHARPPPTLLPFPSPPTPQASTPPHSNPPSPSPPRHGARTPLTDDSYLMLGHTWGPETCGVAYEGGARLDIRGRDGKPPPLSATDEAQMKCKLPGGACHKGELTLLGQRQVGGRVRFRNLEVQGGCKSIRGR